jgi:hypothetical protein
MTLNDTINITLFQDEIYPFFDKEVSLVDISTYDALTTDNITQESFCILKVDGESGTARRFETIDLSGLDINVQDIKLVHSIWYDQDTCEIAIGSQVIDLVDGDNVRVNGTSVDGSEVEFLGVGTPGEWTGINITYESGMAGAGAFSDDIYMIPGDIITDPVFQNFEIRYDGLTSSPTEELEFQSNGVDAEISFMNNDDRLVRIPYHSDGTEVSIGTDTDEPVLNPGTFYTGDPEGVMLLYTTAAGTAHILQLYSVSIGSVNKTTIKDLTYDNYVASDAAFSAGNWTLISLGSLGNINLTIGQNSINYSAALGNNTVLTSLGARLNIGDNSTVIREMNTSETASDTITINLTYDALDSRIEFSAPRSQGGGYPWNDIHEGNDSIQSAATSKGTMMTRNIDDTEVTIVYPGSESYGNITFLVDTEYGFELESTVAAGNHTFGVNCTDDFANTEYASHDFSVRLTSHTGSRGSSSGSSGSSGGGYSAPEIRLTEKESNDILDILPQEDIDTLGGKTDLFIYKHGSEEGYKPEEISDSAEKEFSQIEGSDKDHRLSQSKTFQVLRLYNNKSKKTSYATLFRSSFAPTQDASVIRFIEIIDKKTAESASDMVFIDAIPKIIKDDPILEFSFENVRKGDNLTYSYLINKNVAKPNISIQGMLTEEIVPTVPATEEKTSPVTEEKPGVPTNNVVVSTPSEDGLPVLPLIIGAGVLGIFLVMTILFVFTHKPEQKTVLETTAKPVLAITESKMEPDKDAQLLEYIKKCESMNASEEIIRKKLLEAGQRTSSTLS